MPLIDIDEPIMLLIPVLLIGLAVFAVLKYRKKRAHIPLKPETYGVGAYRHVPMRLVPCEDLIKSLMPASTSQVSMPHPSVWSLDLIRTLEWKRFEELCEAYWLARGYQAEWIAKHEDVGVDVKVYTPSEPRRLLAVVKCKSSTAQVSAKEVRELWGLASHLKVGLAIYYGLTGFTKEAREFAVGEHLKLLTGQDLLTQVQALPTEKQKSMLEHVTRGDYTTPTCPHCDVKMELLEVWQGSHAGESYWSCVNAPVCRQTFDLAPLEILQMNVA